MSADHEISPDMIRAVLQRIREPVARVTTAMAVEAAEGEKRNGHGKHAYRNMWQAAIDAILRDVEAV